MEATSCGVIRNIAILLWTVVLTVLVLIVARRYRQPSWLLPAFVGATLSGAGAAALFSVVGLINIVQGIRVSGAGGLGAVGAGLWEANQTWRVGLYGSLLAAVLLSFKYFLHPRRQATAAERFAPRAIATFAFSILPLLGSVASFATFHGLNDALFGSGSMRAQSGSLEDLVRFVSFRTWMIGISGAATMAVCVLNIPLSLKLRRPGAPSARVERAAGALLSIVVVYVVIILALLLAFRHEMTAAASLGLS
ncbi:MAG TPA: hypothetical protein VMS56_09175 [Thermoanaerobaculia bacterium]|nr:hypothetical protein [Thermoanaerobaculia bacterium]